MNKIFKDKEIVRMIVSGLFLTILITPVLLFAGGGSKEPADVDAFVSWTVNGGEVTTGTVPHRVEFKMDVDWSASTEYWNARTGALSNQRIEYYTVSFGDGNSLNQNNCNKLASYKYKDILCGQPLNEVPIGSKSITHTYFFDQTFTPTITYNRKCKTPDRGCQTEKHVIPNNSKEVNVSHPTPVASCSPALGAANESRELSIACPELYEIEFVEPSGDLGSVDSDEFNRSGSKYMYRNQNVSSGSFAVSPRKTTTYTVACGPADFNYQQYQRYVSKFPGTPFTQTDTTCSVETEPKKGGGKCEPKHFCSGNNIVARNVLCSENVVQICEFGCSGGVCKEKKITECSQDSYCVGDSVYIRDRECNENLVRTCSYGCNEGSCNPDPVYLDVESTVSLKAVPSIVAKGNTSRIIWDVKNAVSCSIEGAADSWDTVTGDKETSPIEEETTYNLSCTGEGGDTLEQSVTVKLTPVWEEF